MKKPFALILYILVLFGCKKTDGPPKPPAPPPPPVTKGLPSLQTNEVTAVTHFSAMLSGKLLDSAGSKIIETGIVVDTLTGPTVSRSIGKFVLQRSSDGTFSNSVDYLPSATTFYIRAYATNGNGTGYGNEVKFTTLFNKVYKGEVVLSSQQQVIDFGANHYTTVDGDITISGAVTDLKPLLGLAVINNGLNILHTLIKDFSGLDSLEIIGAAIANSSLVEYNDNLVNFSGLAKLKISYGLVQIDHNNSLVSLDGLDSYTAASAGSFRVSECNKLQQINGLKKMNFVGSDVWIMNNPALTDITGLSSLTEVYGRLYIDNNTALTNLNGLEKITSLPDGIDLTGDTVLSDISGLRNLSTINSSIGIGTITISGCSALTDLSAFGNIKQVDYVTIINNNRLKNLKGLGNLQIINYMLDIEKNAAMTDLSGIEKLSSLQRFSIFDNPSLVNLKGLSGVTKLINNPYSIAIARNNALVSLTGIENLAEADGTVQIFNNPNLSEFCALKNLFAKGYSQWFYVQYNAANPSQADVLTKCP